jgi:diguanylate cyclase (GGDEF)-like protein/PAS domain S-box-containing protein
MFYMKNINDNIRHYAQQTNSITYLKLLDKDFNYFVNQKGAFSNYDRINAQINSFQAVLENLKKSFQEDNHIFNVDYRKTLTKIEEAFKKKMNLIEHTKSYNSLVINTLSYLHDLKKNIRKFSSLSPEDIEMLDETIFLTLQTYTNIQQALPQIDKNLKKIDRLTEQTKSDYLNYFNTHIKNIVSQIKLIQKERANIDQYNLFGEINTLQKQLHSQFTNYLLMGKFTMISILSLLTLLLLVILYLHKKSVASKKVLAAYKYAIENSDNSVVITDADQNIIYVNDAFEKETGYKKEEVLGENPKILQSGLMKPAYYGELKETLMRWEKWDGEFVNKRKDGSLFYEKASISPLIIDDKLTGYIAIKLNITKYVEQESRVKFLAYHDQLTSLPNRVQFEEFFTQNVQDSDEAHALFFIDLDHFKTINDTLGHHAGDKLLQIFAQRLRHELSDKDFIARIGGDEFVAVTKIKHPEDARLIANRILTSLYRPLHIDQQVINITASIGVSIYPQDGRTLEALLKHADTAMYRAKSEGRNNFHFFTQKLANELYERLNIEQEIRHALQRDEFYLVYQPKYELQTKKIVGFEALIRWENEKLGFVPPDKFISIAEEIGLIEEIGYFVFETASKAFKRFKTYNNDLSHIAVNVSTIQFKNSDFIQNINRLCDEVAISPENIELEVTESYIMENIEQNIQTLSTLREYGYKIAIDDFGTGYSSFAYLKKLPISTLKIDKSFVDDICTHDKDRNIVDTIVTLANNLGFYTVAEGIEDAEQETLLRDMGCMYGQGYHFCRPLKDGDLVAFLQKHTQTKRALSET